MPIGFSRYINRVYTAGDLFILNFSFFIVSFYLEIDGFDFNRTVISQFLYISFFWLIAILIFNINEISRVMKIESVLAKLLKTCIIHFLFLVAFNYFLADRIDTFNFFYHKYLLFVILLFSWRSGALIAIRFFRKRGLNFRRVILVGGGPQISDLYNYFTNHNEAGYRLQGAFVSNKNNVKFQDNALYIGGLDEIKSFVIKNKTDEIFCSLSEIEASQVSELLRFADHNLIRFKLIPDFRGFFNKHVLIDFYDSVPVLSVRKEPLERSINQLVKRIFDILFSLTVIILIFPWLFLIIAILIKLSSPGPVFFRQLRSGKHNEEFTCFKFRTMRVNSEADELQASKNDTRITGVGRFLRKTSMDELPQFFNVLLGNMSVVGPRPHMLKHTEDYSILIEKFMVRHLIKPGITGWAQIWGYRGETRDPVMMQKRVEFDVWYIENWSILLDVKIVFYTIFNMIVGDENAG